MKQQNILRFAIMYCTALSVLSFFQGCSKSAGGSGSPSSPTYYFDASVGGKTFNANFTNPSYGGPGVAETTTANGVAVVIAVGIQIVSSNDTSIFVIVFPTSITLNSPINLDPSLNTGGAYTVEASGGSSTYTSYGTNPAFGGSGTLTVTELDLTNHVVAGTFSGTFGSAPGSPTVAVANGKFKCVIVSASSNPFPPNVKF